MLQNHDTRCYCGEKESNLHYTRAITPKRVTSGYTRAITPKRVTSGYTRAITPKRVTSGYTRAITPKRVTSGYTRAITPKRLTSGYTRAITPKRVTSGPSPRLSAWATQLRRYIAALASRCRQIPCPVSTCPIYVGYLLCALCITIEFLMS